MVTSPRYYLLAEDGTIHRLARSAFYDLILDKVVVPCTELSGPGSPRSTFDATAGVPSVASATFNDMTFATMASSTPPSGIKTPIHDSGVGAFDSRLAAIRPRRPNVPSSRESLTNLTEATIARAYAVVRRHRRA
jgi:hypothetical protein